MKRRVLILASILVAVQCLTSGCGPSAPAPPPPPPPPTPHAAPPTPVTAPVTPSPAPAPTAPVVTPPSPPPPAPAPQPAKPKPAQVIASANLLENGDFELLSKKEIPFWIVPKGVKAVLAADGAYSGKQFVDVTLDVKANLGITQGVTIKPGASYLLRGALKTKNLSGEARFEVQDSEKGYKAFIAHTAGATGTAAWKQVQETFTVNPDTKSLLVYLRRVPAEKPARGTGTASFDNCALYELAAPADVDQLKNGSFEVGENGIAFWNVVQEKAKLTQTDSEKVEGAHSLQIDCPGNLNLGIATGVDVKPGATYSLTGYVKTKNAAGARIEVQDAEKGASAFCEFSDSLGATEDWKQCVVVFTVPESTKLIYVFMRRPVEESAPSTPATMWFDNLSLYEIPAGNS